MSRINNPIAGWRASDIPAQQGRSVVITGTGGLGYEDALALAYAGANVILAGRNATKGAESIQKIKAAIPTASIHFELLDLANLGSISAFANRMQAERQQLDLLINNAAVMIPPQRKTTSDGFELQFGTNHLGHFALTSLLLPLLMQAPSPRVVNVSSISARDGSIHFDDLQFERSYQPSAAYAQSKLANLLFTFELQRRSDAAGWGITSIAAHPGIARTDLLHNGAGTMSIPGLLRSWLWFLFQPAAQGALPTLFAATAPEAQPGAYYGPDRLNEIRGLPTLAKIPPRANDLHVAAQLWEISERLSGVAFPNPS